MSERPLAVEITMKRQDGRPHSRSVFVHCPGCGGVHPFRVEDSSGEGLPTWTWNGSLERPTFSPSLLVYGSVHRCPDEHLVPCDGVDCGHDAHRVLPDGSLAISGPHTVEPAWGNCHSFLTEGRWHYLGDCAHALAGQVVDLAPLPDWWLELRS